jgi:hypothetical protein
MACSWPPVSALTVAGTSWMFWARFSAVTMTACTSGLVCAGFAAATGPCVWACAPAAPSATVSAPADTASRRFHARVMVPPPGPIPLLLRKHDGLVMFVN